MSSPENGQSREGAAFPHNDSSNLPHPVRTHAAEATPVLNYQDNKPIPSLLLRSPHVTLPSASVATTQASRAPPPHQCRGGNGWPGLLPADSGTMDTK